MATKGANGKSASTQASGKIIAEKGRFFSHGCRAEFKVGTEDMKTRAHDEVVKRDKGIRFMFTYVEPSCVSFCRSYTSESTQWRFKATFVKAFGH